MAKQQERNELEALRAIVRNLRSENKSLKKRLNRFEKRSKQYEDLESKIQDIEMDEDFSSVAENTKKCGRCSGKIKVVDLGIRTLYKCESCGHRETKKK